jgi:DNA-binding NtrC family response regulator
VTPVGSSMPVQLDVQVVAATNRDLELEVVEGRFREDLYYRLNMVEFHVPPLRHRVDDIPHFVDYFSRKFATRYERPLWKPTNEALRQFCEYRWPGNIRQLANIIEQAYVLDCQPRLPDRPASARLTEAALPIMDLARLRRIAVRQALRATQGHKGRAARLLGVHPNTMTRLLAQLRGEENAERESHDSL